MNILFDLDGTLTDPYQGITRCISHALVSLDRPSPPSENLKWCIGPPLKNSFSRLLATEDENLVAEALSLYRQRFGTTGLFENEVYEGIPETLGALQGLGHKLYVATSKPSVFAKRIVDHFHLRHYFHGIYGSELDGTRNDKTSLISYILQRELLDVLETAMIGDREFDMIGAKANGVFGFGALWGYGTKEELDASGAHACVSDPGVLVTLFREKSCKSVALADRAVL